MENKYWKLEPASMDYYYIPDAQEIAEMEEMESQQLKCEHKNFNFEDGCLDCGYYSK
jgi:hypothetical protein